MSVIDHKDPSNETPSIRTIIVGTSKPIMNYVTACITVFNDGDNELIVRARGTAINSAVDMVQLLRSRFLKTVEIKDIAIGGEEVSNDEGKRWTLPTIEVTITRDGLPK
ncbi:MAG: DNA-binding protein Alba [Nitrososphaerales archaeon]